MAILTNEALQKLNQYKTYFLKVHPNNERKPNPAYNPNLPEGEDNQQTLPYTDVEWANEVVRRGLIHALRRGQQLMQVEALTQDEFADVR